MRTVLLQKIMHQRRKHKILVAVLSNPLVTSAITQIMTIIKFVSKFLKILLIEEQEQEKLKEYTEAFNTLHHAVVNCDIHTIHRSQNTHLFVLSMMRSAIQLFLSSGDFATSITLG